jgi:DNA ligase-1
MNHALDQQTAPSQEAPATALLRPFAELCDQLAATPKKLEKRTLIATYLAPLPVEDAARAALYLAGTPFAETDPRKLQVGGSTLAKAVAQLSGADPAAMHAAYRRHGDLGEAAFDLLHAPVQPTLTLAELEAAFTALALARGPGPKLALLLTLLARATPLEAKYLIKLISGDMRTGVKQSLVEEAVAACYAAQPAQVRRAVMLNGSLAEAVHMAASQTLDQARMRLFHPLGFMLASPVDSVDEALARFAEEIALEAANEPQDEAAPQLAKPAIDALAASAPTALRAAQLEDKYDGMRAQLHCGDPTQPTRVGLFSRNREDLSESFPELIEAFSHFGAEVILDGEILAWQPAENPPCHPSFSTLTGHPERSEGPALALTSHPERSEGPALAPASQTQGRALPFSTLQQRLGRKRVTPAMRASTPVIFMAFDLLYQSGALLLEHPLADRRARLEALVTTHAPHTDGRHHTPIQPAQSLLFADPPPSTQAFPRLLLAPAVQLTTAAQLDAAYSDARARGNEGVMLKAQMSLYQPGRRGLAWLKLKRELATLDVVITAAEFGHGRRAGVLSDYTFAVRGPVGSSGEPELLNVGKAYSGLTDPEVEALSQRLHDLTLEDQGSYRTVEPVILLEVAFNNITRSTRHASGYALRFPRILRLRPDKPLAEIDTLERVAEIYASQPDKPTDPADT